MSTPSVNELVERIGCARGTGYVEHADRASLCAKIGNPVL